jgi:hypothetical protein
MLQHEASRGDSGGRGATVGLERAAVAGPPAWAGWAGWGG